MSTGSTGTGEGTDAMGSGVGSGAGSGTGVPPDPPPPDPPPPDPSLADPPPFEKSATYRSRSGDPLPGLVTASVVDTEVKAAATCAGVDPVFSPR